MQRSQILIVTVIALLVVVPGASMAASSGHEITGNPGIDAFLPENEVRPGTTTAVNVVLVNNGNVTNGSNSNPQLENEVTTARSVRVSLDAPDTGAGEETGEFAVRDGEIVPVTTRGDGTITVKTSERPVATLPDGASVQLPFRVTVDRDAEPGRYDLPLNVSYNYTQSVDPRTGEENRTTVDKTYNVTLVVEETAQFSVLNVESMARVGATGTVDVTMRNVGSEVARNATVTLTSRNGDLTFGQSVSSSRFVGGTWEPGENRTVSYRVRAAPSASEQQYAFDASVEYEDVNGVSTQSQPVSLGVTPAPEQTFSLVSVDHSVNVGDEGTVALTVRNDGPITARDASMTVQSTTSKIVFGGSASASRYVGAWEPDETRRVFVNATALPDAETRNYSMRASVEYEDSEGDPGQSGGLQFGLRPGPELEYDFTAGEFESDLYVGEDGTLTGTITNTGDKTANNVVVAFETQSASVSPLEREYPVGTLAPGESGTVEFDIDVGGSAEAGPQQFELRPRYRNSDGERRQAESFDVRAEIRPERDIFAVDVADATVPQGESTVLAVTVRNTGNETLSDISAQLFADSPISVGDDEAFVGEIEAGGETTVEFEISAAGTALTKTYPVEMDFQYDDGDGDTQLSDTYRVPVEVTEPEEDDSLVSLPVLVVVAVVLVVLGGAVAYRRFA
ncbi:MAG: COG1361 S-layer family protein [Haloarculaceae archaeon]